MPTPFPVLPGVYYGKIEGQFEGLPCGNIFAFKITPAEVNDAQGVTYANEIAGYLVANWTTTMATIMTNVYTGGSASVYPLGRPTVPAQVATGTWVGGALGGATLPVSTAAVIAHNVMRRGRGSQSRTYISPLSSGQITGDGKNVSSTFQTALATQFTLFKGGVIGDWTAANPTIAMDYVQMSKKGTGASYLIGTSTPELALSTQRRRARRP